MTSTLFAPSLDAGGNNFNVVRSVAGRWLPTAGVRGRVEWTTEPGGPGAEGEPGRGDGRAVTINRCFRLPSQCAAKLARGAMSWTEDANLLSGTADAVSNDFMN